MLQFAVQTQSDISVQVFDITGKQVLQRQLGEYTAGIQVSGYYGAVTSGDLFVAH